MNIAWLFLAGLLTLAGCATPPSASAPVAVAAAAEDLGATYAALSRQDGQLYRVDPTASSVRIYAFRDGAAGRQFGHNHVLSAPDFSGYVFLAGKDASASRFDLAFRLDALALDQPEQRSALGPAFASTISPTMVASTREHMLESLQAEPFPLVRIASLEIRGEAPKLAAHIAVELHGQQRQMWVPLTVQVTAQTLLAEGSLVLQQTDFGVKPYSLLNGLLAVQNPVIVEFSLKAAAYHP